MSPKIFIVGGNSGIGLELIKSLSTDGNQVYAASRSNSNLDGIKNIHYQFFDAASLEPSLSFIPETLDGLVYLPGTISLKPFGRISKKDFLHDMQVNFLGAVSVIQQLIPSLKKGYSPSIVLISTIAVQ